MAFPPETKAEAEALVPQFHLERVLNQGRPRQSISQAATPEVGLWTSSLSV